MTIALEDEDGTIVEGRIDVLVFQNQLWLMVIESKGAGIALEEAIAMPVSRNTGDNSDRTWRCSRPYTALRFAPAFGGG